MNKSVRKSFWDKELSFGGISPKDRLVLVEHLHAGEKAGYNILDTLQLTYSQSRGKMKQVLTEIIEAVKNGAYLYESLEKYPKYFSRTFIHLIRAGEQSASLEESLASLHDVLKKEAEFVKKVRAASIYPFFIFIAIVGLGFSVAFFVLPNLLPLFRGFQAELPVSTRILLQVASFLDVYGFRILLGFVFFIPFTFWLFRQDFAKPFICTLIARAPIFGKLYRKIIMTRFSRTMNSLLKNGITIDQSLQNVADSLSDYYYKKIVRSLIPRIAKGDTLVESLRQYPFYFEPLFVDMLGLGEKTGSLENSFYNVTEYYEMEIDNETRNLITGLEPMLLILVGLVVAFVVISIIGPIYSITGSIR